MLRVMAEGVDEEADLFFQDADEETVLFVASFILVMYIKAVAPGA